MGESEGVILGHHYDNYVGQNFWEPDSVYNESDVYEATGSFPGMFGYDFNQLLRGQNWTEHARWAHEQGGVVEVSWLSANPLNGDYSGA